MKRIPLRHKGEIAAYAIVDDIDFEWLSQWSWKLHNQGYAFRNGWDEASKKQTGILMHRLIADTPPGLQTDHVNRNRLDNRRVNLENTTGSANTRNQPISSRNTSGFRGVTWDKSRGKWQAKTKHLGRHVNLGRFDSPKEAADARALFDASLTKTEKRVSAMDVRHPTLDGRYPTVKGRRKREPKPARVRAPRGARLAEMNRQRTAEAGARDSIVLAAALASGMRVSGRARRVAEARMANPGMTWTQLSAFLAMGRGEVIGLHYRLMAAWQARETARAA